MSAERNAAQMQEIARRRAFAIIAHPDAGKTTLTEKLLLYGGAIHLAGHVRAKRDRRKTRSDWMKMEQDRGISISTAALQFEYKNHVLNLLDTPGHEDFSEDTYRTLMAADCAVMLLDASRGVEPQTIKLFHVCRERGTPIVTFINKMDMPARDPFALMDDIEQTLGITAAPMLWPMGSGKDFRGVYDLQSRRVYRYERTTGGAFMAPVSAAGLDDPELKSIMDAETYQQFYEGAQLAQGALPVFDRQSFLDGRISPVFFGSAMNNFGVELFLDQFLEICPPPRPVPLRGGGLLDPGDGAFTAFVFKLQANMNQKHRDRVAFIRITSGAFERGMSVSHNRLGKTVKLSSPVAFFGQERSTVDNAWAGDIIGLINPGQFQIGDALSAGPAPDFPGVPRFAPEMFARLIPTDTGKLKQFRKGLEELAEEGIVQVFLSADNQNVLGAVGQLQFDVFAFRLQDEYGAPCRLEPLSYERSRWFHERDRDKFSAYDMFVKDTEGRPVVLFKSEYRLQSFQKNNPDTELLEHPPH
ncbi:MAG: peptide chain release factor 3 [Leptospirales bacterium]|nr:peptide chain release factor 3 [Leptospirales bacterium]